MLYRQQFWDIKNDKINKCLEDRYNFTSVKNKFHTYDIGNSLRCLIQGEIAIVFAFQCQCAVINDMVLCSLDMIVRPYLAD
jgi:hypothetical protein